MCAHGPELIIGGTGSCDHGWFPVGPPGALLLTVPGTGPWKGSSSVLSDARGTRTPEAEVFPLALKRRGKC